MAKRFRKLHGDPIIWLVVLLLAMISIVAVYSSSSALAYKNDTTTSAYLLKQSVFVIIGFAFLLACYIFPLKGYRLLSIPAFIVSIGCLFYVIVGGAKLNEGVRWIQIGEHLSFQPSELTKIAVVLYLARILESKSFKTFKEYAIWILAPLGITCILSIYGSVSATLIICLTAFVILICAGIKWRYIWYTIGIAVVALVIIFAVNKLTGKFNRIETFTARIERFFVKEDLSAMTAEELTLGLQHEFTPWFIWYSIIKSFFFAFIITSVASFYGYNVKGGSIEVGKASTNAVVSCSALILFSDIVLTNIMMQ